MIRVAFNWARPKQMNQRSVQPLVSSFIGHQQSINNTPQHTRSLVSRSSNAYRKGRRKAVANVEKTTTLRASVGDATKISERNAGISSVPTSLDRFRTFSGFKQWLATLKSGNEPIWKLTLLALVPKRFRFPSGKMDQMYSHEQGILIAQRLAMWTALVVIMVLYDETAPFEVVGIRGPSMIPTMAADGSDLWLCRKYPSWLRQFYDSTTNAILLSLLQPRLQHGSIIGFAHPDSPNSAIAMKRIVGLPGDRVQRYGQYVHLYTAQDPNGWGITWPTTYDSNHIWIKDIGTTWDVGKTNSSTTGSPSNEAVRTLVVPDGHVWIEADCPALGLDSRLFGPIPISWIRTRVIAKVWPLQTSQTSPTYKRWYHRPHPIPLDVETLLEFNVFYDTSSKKPSP